MPTHRPMPRADMAPSLPLAARLRRGLRALTLTKTIGCTTGIAGFFIAYFLLLDHPLQPPKLLPLTPLDRLLRPTAWALLPYLSLWLYLLLPVTLATQQRELTRYGGVQGAAALLGLAAFALWPTAVPREALQAIDGPTAPAFEALHAVDAAGNACPSLHVACALLAWAWLDRAAARWALPGAIRLANATWAAAIVISTLLTRQHVLWDVLGGVALAGIVGITANARGLLGPDQSGP